MLQVLKNIITSQGYVNMRNVTNRSLMLEDWRMKSECKEQKLHDSRKIEMFKANYKRSAFSLIWCCV